MLDRIKSLCYSVRIERAYTGDTDMTYQINDIRTEAQKQAQLAAQRVLDEGFKKAYAIASAKKGTGKLTRASYIGSWFYITNDGVLWEMYQNEKKDWYVKNYRTDEITDVHYSLDSVRDMFKRIDKVAE
jgi:hypothetical protein